MAHTIARRTAAPCRRLPAALVAIVLPGAARAADLDGAGLSAAWALPFAGLLLSIALLPLLRPSLWHHHQGKIVAGWIALLIVPLALVVGPGTVAGVVAHTVVAEYIPFVILLTALFTVAGGIYVRGNLHGSPGTNVGLMATGAGLASLMGTTGASMLLIRPLLRANDNRRHRAHVVVFFIFIVSNAGGSLTPLGDPPLFLGFLKGVDFFWTARALWPQTLFLITSLLVLFWLIDRHWYAKEGVLPVDPTPDTPRLGLDGQINFVLLGGVIALVLMSGLWKPGIEVNLLGTPVGLEQLVRDAGLVAITALSLWLTPRAARQSNEFGWAPMLEVAKLFIGIFVTMAPVLAMLRAGEAGAFALVARSVADASGAPMPWAYFWFSGSLSSFLDNAPTYLVFFNLAGGDPQVLMTTLAPVLAAISAGSVFMGANTYIGNAPNFMVKAIAEDRGVPMPSFFGYMAWSGCILLPLFGLMTWIWLL